MAKRTRSAPLKFIWFGLLLLVLALNLAGFRPRYEQLLTPAVGSTTLTGQLSTANLQALADLGLTIEFYAGYFTLLEFGGALVFWCLGGLLIWRRPRERMAVLFAMTLMLLTAASTPYLTGLGAQSAAVDALLQILQPVGWTLFLATLLTFPNGRFDPGWTRWLFGVWLLYVLSAFFYPALRYQASLVWETPREALLLVWTVGWLVCGAAVQFYRYHAVATPLERLQTKWVVFGLTIMVLLSFTAIVPTLLFPVLNVRSEVVLIARLSAFSVVLITLIIWSLTIGVAILRFRLFDIDLIIRRTVQYAAVSTILVVIYFGSVVLLQVIFTGTVGEQSPPIIVVSTLLTAALFNPLRHRMQRFIDRRFYRQKYDAQQILAQFAQSARDETDLERLTAELQHVIQDTLQPAALSFWLKR